LAFIEINKNNLLHNINVIQKTSNKEILAVIKDNAYGHGILQIAKILKEAGIKRVCVRNNLEAKLIQPFFEEILVFFPSLSYNAMNISYTISDLNSLKKCKHKKIHLKFDTGMHRNALSLENVDEILETAFNKFEVKGVFSHFCCSDEVGNDTFIQLQRFKELKNRITQFCKKNNYKLPKFHIANSDAIFKLPQNELFDYVRPGIALYGGMNNKNLKAVMSLWGEAIKVMEIKKNEYVGYNKKYKFDKDLKVTLIDLGYSDGILYFDKELILKDTKAVGKISMDSMSVLKEYKKVCIFDDVREFVKNYPYTITYDILTKLKPNIKRVVV
jgi:alanine racemase